MHKHLFNQRQPLLRKGFTLIEILVALFIFALLAIIVAVGMHSILQTRTRIEKIDQNLQNVQMALSLMQRDFAQIIDRPVSDGYGDVQEALVVPSIYEIAFTCAGYLNPLAAENRSELLRVSYLVQGNQLIR